MRFPKKTTKYRNIYTGYVDKGGDMEYNSDAVCPFYYCHNKVVVVCKDGKTKMFKDREDNVVDLCNGFKFHNCPIYKEFCKKY